SMPEPARCRTLRPNQASPFSFSFPLTALLLRSHSALNFLPNPPKATFRGHSTPTMLLYGFDRSGGGGVHQLREHWGFASLLWQERHVVLRRNVVATAWRGCTRICIPRHRRLWPSGLRRDARTGID